MARSPKDDPRFGEIQHHWNFRADEPENCPSGTINSNHTPLTNPGVLLENNLYAKGTSFSPNDVYLNNHSFKVNNHVGDNITANDDSGQFNNVQNMSRVNNLQSYGVLNLVNGQRVQVFFDENNQQLMIPVPGQYELFNNNQGPRDIPLQISQTMFTVNQDYPAKHNVNLPCSVPNNKFPIDTPTSNTQTSSFLKEVLGNWEPNSSGTYSPFGQNYPLNHPSEPSLNNYHANVPIVEAVTPPKHDVQPQKRNENSPLAETNTKKRIVAEVKPMRPSYSDVLAKNTKNNSQTDTVRKSKTPNVELKAPNKTTNVKTDKNNSNNSKQSKDETKQKGDKKSTVNCLSSGSESGDINVEDTEKYQKPSKKNKNKRNMSRKWSSLDDIPNDKNYKKENTSQFILIEDQTEGQFKKNKKFTDKYKNNDRSDKPQDDDENSQFVFQDHQSEGTKIKKKKEGRNYTQKTAKSNQDKKKITQSKWKRNKPAYLGMAQNYLEHWGGATWKAFVWFFYLLSDICNMSAHLSFDLCTSAFTQTYVSFQAVWRSSKRWLTKLADNKYLLYIDKKLGHTRFGFWRKVKWFKKSDGDGDAGLSTNIPMPATGEEAMKRLLACRGKDPYNILGVNKSCTDEEIKRYYRRQAFLVHPDKNQQPGAEEAFKILQHAFDIIGEPERREIYDRRAVESQHVQAAWTELSDLLEQLHDKMEFAANTIRCTNCGRRHKRVQTDRPCYAARYCSQCKIRHSAKEGDIWAESSMLGLLVMYYACMDGAVYQITQWASCQKKNLKQLRPDCHVVQYRIVLGNKDLNHRLDNSGHDPNLEEFLNSLYSKSGMQNKQPSPDLDAKAKKRNKKTKI